MQVLLDGARMGREAGREGRVAVADMVLDSMGRQRRVAGCVRPAAWSRQGTLPRVGSPTALAGRFRPCVRSEGSAGVEWREPTGGSDRRRCHAKAGVKSICLCIRVEGEVAMASRYDDKTRERAPEDADW
jgi:hypothetical protein